MLQPKKTKYRKQFRGKNRGHAYRGNELAFADYGLKAVTGGWVSAQELEAARKKITFVTQRVGRYWIKVFPHKPITRKAVGVKMGSGKGNIEGYVAVVKPGTILFELGGVTEEMARLAFDKAGNKLSVKTTVVVKK